MLISTTQPSSEAVSARDRCHMLIEQIPAEGLKEVEEELTGMCEFYNRPPVILPERPEPITRTGTIVGSFVRPVYPIDLEE